MAGFDKLIGFDMGGTSTDVAHYDGEFERAFETEVAGVRMRAPMMRIHTVAAGGGSILHYDGSRFRVGPDSAGANPGPACYRRGGPLAVSDANVMLGKLNPDHFPKVFGPNGTNRWTQKPCVRSSPRLATEIGDGKTPEDVAEGFIRIAVENMANAIKKISVQRGYDVQGYALNCFGGAGAQHACLIADTLGMKTVYIHPFAGVLSAYGIGLAADPVMLEVFNNLFMSIAEQMGVTLQKTSYSVNIKERLDFSCAVFDAEGALVANAPHMPVHLGSMDKSVEAIIRQQPGRCTPATCSC
jgi:5-oxoprolinase (ATP-hydrolysing)